MDTLTSVAQQTKLPTLLNLHLGLSLFGALSTTPVYNLPVFFFGIWAYHNHDSNAPIKTFTGILALTIILDVVWFILHGSELLTSDNQTIPHARGFGFCMFMNIISLIGKPVTVFASISTLQSRGESLGAGGGDWSEAPGAFPGAYQVVRDGEE